MRQRKVKNEAEKLASYPDYLPEKPEIYKGKWQGLFEMKKEVAIKGRELYIEVGCGKGKFITDLAEQNPDCNYIGIEGQGSVILRALEKGRSKQLPNLVFIHAYIKDIGDYFDQGEISGIYLNFSDPWPKDRHDKRRLTHRSYLEGYKSVLKKGQFIAFKTDNNGLFDFALEEFQGMDMEILECTRDLHGSDLPARLVTTEYEEKFKAEGKPINYCKVKP